MPPEREATLRIRCLGVREMLYLGIDIGKKHHEAGFVADDGKRIGKSLRFSNDRKGYESLLDFIKRRLPQGEEMCIGMEATGHYWLALYSFLLDKDFVIHVINPIQSDSLRNFRIRQTKTDSVDSFLIAETIRFGNFETTRLAEEDTLKLRELTRFRESFQDDCSSLKRQVVSIMDKVFPEYESLFSDMFCRSSNAVLKECVVPGEVMDVDLEILANLLKEASRGRLGAKKAMQIKDAAASSIGVLLCSDTLAFQIRMLLENIEFTGKQIARIDSEIENLMSRMDQVITTVPGVGPVTGAVMLGEIGDINRFDSPRKLVAYAGLDSQLKQSGSYEGKRNRMSKRGSPYLRRAFWMSAVVAAQYDPVFKAFYEKKRKEGKAYGTAIGAVARKLAWTVYSVLKTGKPYEVRLDTIV